MGELTGSMNEIAQVSAETQKIVKTIDEIAFQTNLLADERKASGLVFRRVDHGEHRDGKGSG